MKLIPTMKTTRYLLLLHLAVLAACSDLTEQTDPDEVIPVDSDQLFAIHFSLPGFYSSTSTPDTRADVDETTTDTGGNNNNEGGDSEDGEDGEGEEDEEGETTTTIANEDTDLAQRLNTDGEILKFDNGTTLWILVEEKNEKGEYEPMSSSLNVAYMVSNVLDSEGNIISSDMVPCTTDDQGNAVSTESKLLYLPKGEYRIRALSPALKLDADNNVLLSNGELLLANYDRCAATAPTELSESDFAFDGTSKAKEVTLNPLVHQTAYLQFDIQADPTNGTSIYSIEPMESACVISGLQSYQGSFNWISHDPKWTIYLNAKDQYVSVSGAEFSQESETHLSFGTHILPTSIESTTIYVTFNLRVNGVPTQYMTSITDKVFYLGYKYPFNVYVSLSSSISMATWVNSSTSQTITITPK
jgi:hypothetical protein